MPRRSRAMPAWLPTARLVARAVPGSRPSRPWLVLLAVVGCSVPAAPAAPLGLVPSSGRLPAPPAADPAMSGAAYLNLVASYLTSAAQLNLAVGREVIQ